MTLSKSQISELHQKAQSALKEGRAREAHQCCLKILDTDRHHADAWFLCGVIAGQNRQYHKAVQILNNATSLAPDRAEYLAELSKCLLQTNNQRQALETARCALALSPPEIPTLNTLGTVLTHCGDNLAALDCFNAAVAQAKTTAASMTDNPDYYAELYLNLGLSLQFAGDIAAAEAAFEHAINLRPAFFKAHSALSTLQRQTPERNHLERLEQLKKGASTAVDKLHVGHALAREQEDLGQLHAAIESLQWAKREQAREVKYSFEQERVYFHNIRAIFDRDCFESHNQGACDNDEPIFIVGMPRTGTTLVEQILGSHSKVFAAGELQQFPQQVLSLTDVSNPGALTTNRLQQLIDKDLQALGQGYIDNTRPRTGHTSYFIDKLPRNFLYLGLIYLALPRAKLICLRRDPMDTCLSNYRQLFANQLRQYQYNLDLLDCGRYYIEFDKLMRHWRQTIPGEVYELSYESLVDNQEAETRKLLDFCNLTWEDDCLTFHQRRNAVATPSAGQVKQGIYSHSVDRWKRFGDAMDPLYALLREAGYYT